VVQALRTLRPCERALVIELLILAALVIIGGVALIGAIDKWTH
jgi:hypothetical protein